MKGSRPPGKAGASAVLDGSDAGIPLHDCRVLIADASAFNRKTLVRFLGWAGVAQVDFAHDGAEVLAKVGSWKPDLLILDMVLQGISAADLCRDVRRAPDAGDLPILIQSPNPSDQIRLRCFHAGASDVIDKPANPGEFISRARYLLERHRLVRELRSFRERVARDLGMARDMQLGLVPEAGSLAALSTGYGLSIDAHFQTSDEIGGDFWTVFELDRSRLGIFIADLTGHGIPAAINAFRLHTLLTRVPHEELLDPAALMGQLNNRLHDILPVGHYATALYGILDVAEGCLTYAAAGAPSPILGRDGRLERCEAEGWYLGAFADESFDLRRAEFPVDSFLFLYSDAVTESRDAEGNMLGEDGLHDLVRRVLRGRPAKPLYALLGQFTTRCGERLHDDLTLVWIGRR